VFFAVADSKGVGGREFERKRRMIWNIFVLLKKTHKKPPKKTSHGRRK